MYLLSKHVRENNIKVVVTGEGLMSSWEVITFSRKPAFADFGTRSAVKTEAPAAQQAISIPEESERCKQHGSEDVFRLSRGRHSGPALFASPAWHNTSRLQYYFADEFLPPR
jgi:hypothetical protein